MDISSLDHAPSAKAVKANALGKPPADHGIDLSMIRLSLPYPPSANRLWRNFKGRSIKSAEYRDWLNRGQAAIIDACIGGQFSGPYHLEIQATRPDRRARDIDNLIKPTSDLIATAGLVTNDSNAQSVKASWAKGEPKKGGALHVWLWGAE